MTTPLPFGPINAGDPVLLVFVDSSNVQYVLNAAPFSTTNTQLTYYWDSDINTASTSPTLPVFTFRNNLFIDSVNGGGISLNNNNIAVNSTTATTFTLQQTNAPAFTAWFSPVVALSGVQYNLLAPNGQPGTVYADTTFTNTLFTTNIVLLPVVWYGTSTAVTCGVVNTPVATLVNWSCNISAVPTYCQTPLLPAGWTQLDACNAGITAGYCESGALCGTAGCAGPCSQIYYDCDPANGAYSCNFSSEQFVDDKALWEQPWFIGVIVAIVLSIIVLVLVTIYIVRK